MADRPDGGSEFPLMNDRKIKDDQVLMRDMIEQADQDGLKPIERAMAMFMEADTYLRRHGVSPQLVLDA